MQVGAWVLKSVLWAGGESQARILAWKKNIIGRSARRRFVAAQLIAQAGGPWRRCAAPLGRLIAPREDSPGRTTPMRGTSSPKRLGGTPGSPCGVQLLSHVEIPSLGPVENSKIIFPDIPLAQRKDIP
jgi:hypothetical protein